MIPSVREEVETIEKEAPEAVFILHKVGSPDTTLSIVADGKNLTFSLNRRMLFGILTQCADALHAMEPGKWVSPYKE